jgi:putative transposase
VSRNSFYYQPQLTSKKTDKMLDEKVKAVFNDNYQSYGTRQLQVELRKKSIILPRRRIGRIMQENGLVL